MQILAEHRPLVPSPSKVSFSEVFYMQRGFILPRFDSMKFNALSHVVVDSTETTKDSSLVKDLFLLCHLGYGVLYELCDFVDSFFFI